MWAAGQTSKFPMACIIARTIPPAMEKLSSRKLVPGAKKAGDHCFRLRKTKLQKATKSWILLTTTVTFVHSPPLTLDTAQKLTEATTKQMTLQGATFLARVGGNLSWGHGQVTPPLPIPFGKGHLGSYSNLALASFNCYNTTAQVASFSIHLDPLLKKLLL